MDLRSGRPGASLDWYATVTALVFSAVCWLVFSKLFDTHDSAVLPALVRRFLAIQPWWFGAGLLGAGLAAITRSDRAGLHWRRASQLYSLALSAFSMIAIGWGIVAMYLLTLPAVDP